MDERGLPTTARTDHSHELPSSHLEVKAVKNEERTIGDHEGRPETLDVQAPRGRRPESINHLGRVAESKGRRPGSRTCLTCVTGGSTKG